MISWSLPELEPFTLAESPPVDLPYAELALDPATWDVAYPVRVLTGGDAILQRIKVRFRFFLGEWFLDTRLGVPYFRDILIKSPDLILVSAIFRQVLLTTPGVKSVASFTSTPDWSARLLTADFEATLDDGTRIVAQAEPFIIG